MQLTRHDWDGLERSELDVSQEHAYVKVSVNRAARSVAALNRWLRSLPAAALVAVGTAWSVGPGALADQPTPMVRGNHVSSFVRFGALGAGSASSSVTVSCSSPGSGNYKVNCHGTGRPVNETWISTNGSTYVAGANDYNSYNGQGQDGYYWSTDAKTWNDAGPIDVFPHNTNNAAGDPGLAIDSSGVVYYSSLFFNFHNCSVGGVELLRRNPSTGAWTYAQIAADSRKSFQDKPAIAIDGTHVWESWTQFGSCTGVNVTSPIRVAIFPTGSNSVAPSAILSVPGSTYSQGSSIKADGSGGFWIAWEEFPSASATTGEIELAHYNGTSWSGPATISPRTFVDLPSPLPGFSFRDNSFPALAVVSGSPRVVWTSYDTGVGRASLWSGTTASAIDNSGGSQFFPSIYPGGGGSVYVAFSQVNLSSTNSYDQWLVHGSTVTKVSTASSFPNQDKFFSGQFIGDYNGLTGTHPIWTDIRGPDPNYATFEMDGMVSA